MLKRSPDAPRAARRFVAATLREWSCDALVEVAGLLASELVSNAVMHGQGDVRLTISITGHHIRLAVVDGGRQRPFRRPSNPSSPGGRGLLLVEQLSTSWGVDELDAGKSVWCTIDTRARSPW